jgi:hypothetical protein
MLDMSLFKQGLYSGPAMFASHLVRLPSMAFLPKTGEVGYILAVMTCDGTGNVIFLLHVLDYQASVVSKDLHGLLMAADKRALSTPR